MVENPKNLDNFKELLVSDRWSVVRKKYYNRFGVKKVFKFVAICFCRMGVTFLSKEVEILFNEINYIQRVVFDKKFVNVFTRGKYIVDLR